MGERLYYLDHAAATPCDPRVVLAMQPYVTDVFYNPSASYAGGLQARQAVETARQDIALLLGAKSHDIIFTAGATESINLAISGVLAGGGHGVCSGVEHPAVREAMALYDYSIVPVDRRGYVTPDAVKATVTDKTTLVSIALADNEFGTVQPIADIARALAEIREIRKVHDNRMPLYLHCDASQGATALEIKVARLGVDLLTLNAGKCYGPKQVGLLWVNPTIKLEPFIRGGGQERSLRSGTENVAGVVGFARALQLVQKNRYKENERLALMRHELMRLLQDKLPMIVFDGHPKRHLPGHLHFHVDGLDAERVVFHLDNKGIYIATGAACAANKATRSPSLEAVGMTPSEADGSLRITLGHLNQNEDIPFITEKVIEAIETERKL